MNSLCFASVRGAPSAEQPADTHRAPCDLGVIGQALANRPAMTVHELLGFSSKVRANWSQWLLRVTGQHIDFIPFAGETFAQWNRRTGWSRFLLRIYRHRIFSTLG